MKNKKIIFLSKIIAVLLAGGLVFCGQAGVMAAAKRGIPQMIVDQEFSGNDGEVVKGIVHYKTLSAALKKSEELPPGNLKIFVRPGVYREKIMIKRPDLVLIGENVEHTQIVFDDAEGTLVRTVDGGDGQKCYVMDCASVTIADTAVNFQAKNITFSNDFDTVKYSKIMQNHQAFALRDEADRSSFFGCRFLGRQDTLYANKGRQYYKNCYIEGDVDFVFGGADAVYDGCEIHSLQREGISGGFITAPSTLAANKGFLFYRCQLTGDKNLQYIVKLGRPWHPSSETRPVNSAAVFKECRMEEHISSQAWSSMRNKYALFQPEDNRLFEYNSTGPGAEQNKNRRYLNELQAQACTIPSYLSNWLPQEAE